jgi:hypothetical protein
MNNKTIGLIALFAIGLIVTTGAVSAFGGFGNMNADKEAIHNAIESGDFEGWKNLVANEARFEQMKARHQERAANHEAVQVAFEAEDYETFLDAMPEDCLMADKITEENFDTFVSMHEAKQDGDFETAQKLAQELGFEGKARKGFGGKDFHRFGAE